MSPTALQENLNIKTVAVIGAGPCGLAGAKYAFFLFFSFFLQISKLMHGSHILVPSYASHEMLSNTRIHEQISRRRKDIHQD